MTRLPALRVSMLVLAVIFVATNAGARTCGDADKIGGVTVTDGVQTLRAASGLSSSCNLVRCDVDGSDSLTVTDGVNVLRKAAGLFRTRCLPGRDRHRRRGVGRRARTLPRLRIRLRERRERREHRGRRSRR